MFFYLDNANSRHGVSLTHCRANRFDATHFKDYFLHVSELRFADEAEIELQRSFRRSGLMVQVFDLQTLRTFFAAHQRLEAENDALKQVNIVRREFSETHSSILKVQTSP